MKSLGHLNFWMKGAQALLLAVAVCFALGASDAGSRFTDLGHRLMCTCGCSQMLGECNHVGCPESDRMRGELRDDIASNMGDKEILTAFSTKYGVTVLAAPTTHGFNLVAWIAPFAVLLAATFGVVLLVRHWTVGKTAVAGGPDGAEAITPEMAAIRDKIRRETGADGGF
jgi:cytochrome c-type biogenesis protein CcmH